MSEVQRNQVEEIDDEENFANPETAADPEHDEAKSQKVMLSATSALSMRLLLSNSQR